MSRNNRPDFTAMLPKTERVSSSHGEKKLSKTHTYIQTDR